MHDKNDVYLFVNIFDNVHFTKLSYPDFPLEIHESFSFEKVLPFSGVFIFRDFLIHYHLMNYAEN